MRAFSERGVVDGSWLHHTHWNWLSICIICFLYCTFPHLERNSKALITSVTHYAFWVILRFTYNYRQKLCFIIMPFVLSQLSFTLQVWYQQLLNGILTYWAKYDGMCCLLLLRQPAESYEGIQKPNVRSQVTLFWIVPVGHYNHAAFCILPE